MLEARDSIYCGKIIQLTVDTVTLPNGSEAALEIVHHPGGAAAAAVDHRGHVCLLRQYRHAIEDWCWELPAGKLEAAEPPLQAAQRELAEEAGCRAGRWQSLGSLVPSPGILTEKVHLFLARELDSVASAHEAHEVIEIHWLPLAQACAMADAGEIFDAKTVIALYRTAAIVGAPSAA